jgi:crotonobetainyl-CoA:carnitine CoA-transferase CaiB-like acyl-CoA transferase
VKISELLVVELGTRPGVSACGGLLRDLGATVVVVEDLDKAERAQRAVRIAGKRSVAFGSAAAEAATLSADVVIVSSDVDDLLHVRAPGQVLCDISAFGRTGPLAGVPASEAQVQAWCGSAAVTGRRDGPPLVTPAPLLEMEAAVYAAAAVVTALRVRDRRGVGQEIDIALFDVGVNALAAFLPLPFSGREATRSGNRHPILSPWNTYPTRDGWVMICAPTDDQWRRLCTAMGVPDHGTAATYATTSARLARLDAVDALISQWTSLRSHDECLSVLAAAGIASGPIVTLQDLSTEGNVVHRGTVHLRVDPLNDEPVLLPGSPFGTGQAPGSIPLPGADAEPIGAMLAARSAPSESREIVGGLPLAGIRVIEIGMNTVAPLAGRQLGALGADVIKVEPPQGDVNRSNAPLREDGEAYIFSVSNTDKRGVVLDLREEEDRSTLWGLLGTADVLIENLKPGSLDRLGFSADVVRDRHPELVYCSVTGFGHDSAYAQRPALDSVIQAMSGLMAATTQEGMPTKAGISISDQLGGQLALLAVVAALLERDAGAGGRRLDLAMQDVTIWATQELWNDARSVPVHVVAAADGHVVLEGELSDLLGTRLAVEDPDEALATAKKIDRAELVRRLNTDAAPSAAPVLTVDEVLRAEQTEARELLLRRPTADGDTWVVLESPLRLSRTAARVRTAMPRLGVLDMALADELQHLAQPSSAAVLVRQGP